MVSLLGCGHSSILPALEQDSIFPVYVRTYFLGRLFEIEMRYKEHQHKASYLTF